MFVPKLKLNKMKRDKIIYYVATGLLSLLMFFSVGMYFFNHDMVAEMYKGFGYPTYLIYPLGVAKLLGVIVLWAPKLKTLKEWAYSAFFFEFVLAFFAHVMIGDGEQSGAVVAMVLLLVSYTFYKRINN